MALPSTPPISLSQIQAEVGLGPGASLVTCLNASSLAKTLPVNMTAFLGYSHNANVPGVPRNFTATVSQSVPRIRLSWAAPTVGGAVATYRLERSINSGGFTLLDTLPDFLEGYDDLAIARGNSYAYRIRSENGSGQSPYATTGSTLIIHPPNIPTNFNVNSNGNRLEITWNGGVGGGAPTNYRLEQSFNGGAYTLLANVAGSQSAYLSDPKPSGSYVIQIRAENDAGVSAYVVADFPVNI